MRLSPSFRDGWLPAVLIVAAMAAFAALAFRVPGDLRLVPAAIDPDLVRTPPPSPGNVDPAKHGRLGVKITGIRSAQGKIAVALYTRGPLTGGGGVLDVRIVPASPDGVAVTFDDVPQGTYAVAAFHDENGNGRLDLRDGGGPPTEGIGTSNQAGPPTGPPQFENARFVLDRDALELTVPLHYL